MKKLLLGITMILGCSFMTSAQITAEDIVAMMDDVGTTPEQIKTVYVGSTMSYYTDGTKRESYDKYNYEKGNRFDLADNGIRVNYKPDGQFSSVFYIPYTSILTFEVGKDFINIFLYR